MTFLKSAVRKWNQNAAAWGGERWERMKNSGTRKAMQTPTWKNVCAVLCLLLLLSVALPVKAAAETAPVKVVRVGSFEDTFNYVNEKGIRKGYGYELLQTLSGYTGWQLEYVTCDWSDCFEKLKNGEIDIMGDISYTEDRAEEMLFSDEPMGEEKYYLYADLSREDITASDFKTLNGKKIGVLMGTEPEVMLTEWEEKYDLKTQHVNISNNEDVKQKLKVQRLHHKIDNIRTDYINKSIAEIVKTKPSYITIENLNVSGMMKNSHLSKAVASQKFYEFRTKLKAKCDENGIELRVVDRWYPSSKICHCCGAIKKDLKLSDRIYRCDCGYVEDRDFNAALNLRDALTYEVA